MADILFLEPFYGGSHKYFADGLIRHSRHKIQLLTLPGRFWKWRMESASSLFAQQIKTREIQKPEIVLATNLMDLTQFKGLSGWNDIPHILYVHENQLDYPLSPGEKRDFHYVWKDYLNFLTADRLIFNSRYNLDSFLIKFKDFSARLPDNKPADPTDLLRSKTEIIPPGCHLIEPSSSAGINSFEQDDSLPPVILWNQRWEHDKNPEAFFSFLKNLQQGSIPFRLILLGEQYKDSPSCFIEALEIFKEELIHYGYAESRSDYETLLQKSDFVLSTAMQENFGISIVEAMSCGAIPLLPHRLAYPEVLPGRFHARCLFRNEKDMINKYIQLNELDIEERKILSSEINEVVSQYSWIEMTLHFDSYIDMV